MIRSYFIITIITKVICSTTIAYSQTKNEIQALANKITFNIASDFSSSTNIEINVLLPSQILTQDNIVCGINGVTNGDCQLIYGIFVFTFTSATTTFQISFMNVNNPITTYTDLVQINASVISTKASIFTKTIQLEFQQKSLDITITPPSITYVTSPLILSIDGSSTYFPQNSIITLTTNGIISNSATIANINYGTFTINNGNIIINSVKLSNQTINTINITQFTIQSKIPIQYTLNIQDSNNGYITSNTQTLIISNLNNSFPYTLNSDTFIVGQPTTMTILLCNLAQDSVIQYTSTLSLQYTTVFTNQCYTSSFTSFNNPLSLNTIAISQTISLNGYDSISQSISYQPIKDSISIALTQNTTIMLNYAQIVLTLSFNQQFSNFFIILNNQYDTNSCTIMDLSCTQYGTNYTSQQITSEVNKVTIKLEILIPGCNQYSFYANLLYSNQILATSNSITPTFTKYTLQSTLTTSSFIIGDDVTFNITGLDSTQITAYYVSIDLQNYACSDCIISNSQLQFGSVNFIQFTATNNMNIKTYTIIIQAYKDSCLIASQTFKQAALATQLTLGISSSNYYYQTYGNWTVTIAPDMEDKGILNTPLTIPDDTENRINSSAIYINSTKEIYNLSNLYSQNQQNLWQISYYNNGYLYAYGNATIKNLDIMSITILNISKQNTIINEQDNITIYFNTSFIIPSYGSLSFNSQSNNSYNITLNQQLIDEFDFSQILPIGTYMINFGINFTNTSLNSLYDTFNITTFDDQNRILQSSSLKYQFNYGCSINDCTSCTISECKQCQTNFTLNNNTCELVCSENQTIINNTCVDQDNNINNNNNNNNNTNSSNNDDNYFYFTPPIISPLTVLIFLFSISRKCFNRESETFIIFYAFTSIMEHIIQIFLFVYYFVTYQFIFGLCMVSIIIVHFSSQIYIVLMNLFKFDPEYIGLRQQNDGFKWLHIFSLTFCGRLLLLLISKFNRSYVWSTPWTYKLSVFQRLQNYLLFLLIEQCGVIIIVVFSLLDKLYLFFIEILSFEIIQISVTIYTYFHLRNQTNIEKRLNYI